ncbi:hypothetical protein AVDCRST_MAG94-2194, partial [uncultured Leptolyngbya sp.]
MQTFPYKAYSTSHESQGNLAERAIDCL